MNKIDDRNAEAGISAADGIDLRRLGTAIVENWRTLATATAIAMAIASLVLLLSRPAWVATAKVLIDTRQQRVLTAEQVLPGLSADTAVIDSQVEILTSGKIARLVLAQLDNEKHAGNDVSETAFTDRQVRDFLSRLSVARIGLTDVVEISYRAKDPVAAADIANRIASTYLAEEAEAMVTVTQKANRWLQERIKQLGPDLLASEKHIEDYRAANGLISIGEQTVAERNIVDYIAELSLARAALAEAQARLDLDKSKSGISLQSQDDFEVAKQKVTLMERGLQALTSDLVSRRKKALEVSELERDANASKALYESLLKRQKETEAEQNLTTLSARIIQDALPPAWPAWPKKSLLLLAALAAGTVAGVLVIAGRLILFDTAFVKGDVTRRLGLRCDIAIPRAAETSPRRIAIGGHFAAGTAMGFLGQRGPFSPRLVCRAALDSESAFGKAIRLLYRRAIADQGAKVVAVVSPRAGDGKTTVAANLAFAIAAEGRRTLLVDLDPETRQLTRLLKRWLEPAGETGQAREEIVRCPALPPEAAPVMLAGWSPETSEPDSERRAFKTHIEGARDRYELIILDTAAADGVDASDAPQLADTVILLIARGQTPLRDAQSVLLEIIRGGYKPVTPVFNKA